MNQSFAKLTFFAGLALAGANSAQAQSPNPVDSHIGDVNTSIINLMNNPLGPKGSSSATAPLTGDTQLHVKNAELSVGTTIKLNDSTMLRTSAALDKVLVAAGGVFRDNGTEQVTGFVGGSRTINNIRGKDSNNSSYNTRVSSYSAFAEIRASTPWSNVPISPNAITIGASVHNAGKKLLHSSSIASQTSKQHTNSTHVVDIGPDSTTYTDTETTTTVTNDWLTTYNTLYSGGSLLQARLSADWNIGQNGVATITLAQDTKNIPGESEQKHTSWDAQYKHSFDNSSALVRVNNNGRVDLGFNMLINNMSVGAGVFADTGGGKNKGASVTINYRWGTSNTQSSSSNDSQDGSSSGTKRLGDSMNNIGTWTPEQAKGANTLGIVTTRAVNNNTGHTMNVTNKVKTRTVEHVINQNDIRFVNQERIALEGSQLYEGYETKSQGALTWSLSDNDIASIDSYGVVTIKNNILNYFDSFRTVTVTLNQEKWTNQKTGETFEKGVATYTIHILCNLDTNSNCFLNSDSKNRTPTSRIPSAIQKKGR